MAYIGLAPFSNFLSTASQTFNGDGSTKQFTLNRSVSKAEDLEVFVANVQILPTGFTASGITLTFTNAPAFGTNNIYVIFRAGALQSLDVTRTGNPAGTVSAPSLYFTGATNTGIYWPTTTKVAVATSGADRIIIDDASASSSTSTGALQVKGGIGATGNLYLGGLLRLTDATQATNVGSGSLVTAGGVGIAKDVHIGGSIFVTGDFTVAGTTTTTSSSSLAIDDPFVFLAGTNSGDTIDQGLIGKYVQSTVTRYTGLFRDATDGIYKVFANLTALPSTTVDTANVSFKLAGFRADSIGATGQLTAESGVASSSTTTGALVVTGGIGATGAVYAGSLNLGSGSITATGALGNVASVTASGVIQTTGLIYANAGTASGSTTTGALVVLGGVGVSGNVNAGNVNATNFAGTLITASQPNVTATGNLTTLDVTGRIRSIGQIQANSGIASTSTGTGAITVIGGIGATGNVTSGNVTATIVAATSLVGTLVTAAQPNVTSLGTLAATLNTQTVAPSANVTYNLGSTSLWYNTVYGQALKAQYADLAENYTSDHDYEPGTVVVFGGEYEVTVSSSDMNNKVAGVVSTNPAYTMNSLLEGDNAVTVALVGRVPCKVVGPVAKGDMMVSTADGRARAEENPRVGSVIGKALENFDGAEGVIEVVVGRL